MSRPLFAWASLLGWASLVALSASTSLGGIAGAQAASSPNHFIVGAETGAGGNSVSPNHRLTGSFGPGVIPGRSASTTSILEGGFPALFNTTATGRPWLTGARPLYVPYQGGITLALHGTELDMGASSSVSLDTTTAPVQSRTRDRVSVTVPAMTLEPGWRKVTLNNSGGTTVLPRGVGVLPLLEKNRAIEIGEPFRVTYRGYPGDLVYIAIAGAKAPPIRIRPYHGKMRINLGTLIEFFGPLTADRNGLLHIHGPRGRWSRPVVVQMLGVHRQASLGPGAITNVLEL